MTVEEVLGVVKVVPHVLECFLHFIVFKAELFEPVEVSTGGEHSGASLMYPSYLC